MSRMPKAKDAKTHATHEEALAVHGGRNPNGVHGAHLNLDTIRSGRNAASEAFESGEWALLDIVDVDLGGGVEGTMFVKRRVI